MTDLLPDRDNYMIGFADMDELLKAHFPFHHAIVVGARLNDSIVNGIKKGPTLEYFNHYAETNKRLNAIVENISKFLVRKIENQFIRATAEDHEMDAEYWKTLRDKYSHKMAATRAGIGWIGKTDLLVSERFGPRLRLAGVLANYPFERPGIPITESRCGSCAICVEACPAQAASGRLWNTEVGRDDFYNAAKCRKMCRKRTWESLRKEISLCGVCVSVCPKGREFRPAV